MACKFNVGDVVRIRQWDDMAEEFGINRIGHIKCPFTFTPSMKNFCGDEVVIASISQRGVFDRYYLEGDKSSYSSYSFSKEMLEPIEPIISIGELNDVLQNKIGGF